VKEKSERKNDEVFFAGTTKEKIKTESRKRTPLTSFSASPPPSFHDVIFFLSGLHTDGQDKEQEKGIHPGR